MNDIQAEAKVAFERVRQAQLRVAALEAKAAQEVLAELQGLLGEGEK